MYSLKRLIGSLTSTEGLRNGILYSLFSFINKGFSFVLVLILVKFISPAEYGTLNLFGTVVMVVGYCIALSTDNYLSVAYFRDGESGIRSTVSSVLPITLIIGLIFVGVIIAGGENLSSILDLPSSDLLLAVVICFFTVYLNLNLDLHRIKQKLKVYGCLSISNALLNLVLSVLFVYSFKMGWEGRVFAQTLCCMAYGLFAIYVLLKNNYIGKINITYLKSMLIWGLPLIPHVATNFIRQGCDRYIINSYYSLDDVGLFSFALNISNIIILIGLGFNQSNSVDIYKVLGDKELPDDEKINKIRYQNRVIRIIYIVCSLIIPLISITLTPIFLPKYSSCVSYIPILSVCAFFNCLYFLYTNFLFFYKKTKVIMTITLLSSIVHLLLSLIFTRYSLYYTCIVYCVSQFLILVAIRFFAKKEIKKQIGVSL